MKNKDVKYSEKEIAVMLNNLVIAQRQAIEGRTDARIARLRAYTKALIDPCFEHMAEGLLTKEEACFVITSAALLLFMKSNKITKLPAEAVAKEVYENN